MSNVRQIFIVILSVVLVFLLMIITYKVFFVSNNDEDGFGSDNVKIVSMCNEKFACGVPDAKFEKIILDGDTPDVVVKKADKLNDRIYNDYKKVLNSNVSSKKCADVRESHAHSSYIVDTTHVYDNVDYTVLSLISVYTNMCENYESNDEIITVFYNNKTNKFLTEKEFLVEVGLNEVVLNEIVQKDVVQLGTDFQIDYSKPYRVYVMETGDVMVSYYTTYSNISHSTYTNIKLGIYY